ncbi:unnamed protein product [Amoebophrya sp. A25]|nr:unnamed protein product [Amoebophrya sp. A25]|eukprot:GSA25T00010053001.1
MKEVGSQIMQFDFRFRSSTSSGVPQQQQTSEKLSSSILFLAVQKLVLAEGEKVLLLLWFSDAPEVWGTYALITNLGSLVLRLLFAPVEDVAYAFFSANSRGAGEVSTEQGGEVADVDEDAVNKLDDSTTDGGSRTSESCTRKRNTGPAPAVADEKTTANSASGSPLDEKESYRILFTLLTLQGGIGYLALLYGPANAYFAIRILYGPSWADVPETEAVRALQVYCPFLFLAALNGILEAFTHARANATWLFRNAMLQLGLSVLPVLGSWALNATLGWRAPALIAANAGCMLLRVIYCSHFVLSSQAARTLVHEYKQSFLRLLAIWTAFAALDAGLEVMNFGKVRVPPLEQGVQVLGKRELVQMGVIHVGSALSCLCVSAFLSRHELILFARSLRTATSKRTESGNINELDVPPETSSGKKKVF